MGEIQQVRRWINEGPASLGFFSGARLVPRLLVTFSKIP
jgi:hypothetical protein